MNKNLRSIVLAVLGGMMLAGYLHTKGAVDLGFGFPQGSLAEGAFMTVTGAAGGYFLLIIFRKAKSLLKRNKREL